MEYIKYKERVELHCHTNQSEGYGVSDVEDILQLVKEENMRAVAFADYGNLYSYSKIQNYVQHFFPEIKPIYGLELLVAEDLLDSDAVGGKVMFDDMPVNYVLLLVENEKGLENMYKLLSEANMQKKKHLPWIKWSCLLELREGLLLGSTGSVGELFGSILSNCEEAVVEKIANRYDFLEVHPIGNYKHKFVENNSKSRYLEIDVKKINDSIISLGKKLGIPVVATSDTHYLRDKQRSSWQVLVDKCGHETEIMDELSFKTTEEMLSEFEYLGEEKAYEIVIENTNMIAERIQKIFPIQNMKRTVKIHDADNRLQILCEQAMKKKWPEMPEHIVQRMELELENIKKNGFSAIYLHYYDLVHKNKLHPSQYYLVGKAASSLIVYLLGISQTNPFDSDCTLYTEVFTGYHGNKEPLIQLRVAWSVEDKVKRSIDELEGVERKINLAHRYTFPSYQVKRWIADYESKYNRTFSMDEKESIIGTLERCVHYKGQFNESRLMIIPEGTDIEKLFPLDLDSTEKEIIAHFNYTDIDHMFLIYDVKGNDRCELVSRLYEATKYYPTEKEIGVAELFHKINSLSSNTVQKELINNDSADICEYMVEVIKKCRPKSMVDYVKLCVLFCRTEYWEEYGDEFVKNNFKLEDLDITIEDIYEKLLARGIRTEETFSMSETFRKRPVGIKQIEIMQQLDMPEWIISYLIRVKHVKSRADVVEQAKQDLIVFYYKINYPDAFEKACELVVENTNRIVEQIKYQ